MALVSDACTALAVWAALACMPLHAQSVQVAPGAAGRIMGEVVALDAATQNISLKTDNGEAVTVVLTGRATLRKVPPGAPDLAKAAAIAFADLSIGFGDGLRNPETRRHCRSGYLQIVL